MLYNVMTILQCLHFRRFSIRSSPLQSNMKQVETRRYGGLFLEQACGRPDAHGHNVGESWSKLKILKRS